MPELYPLANSFVLLGIPLRGVDVRHKDPDMTAPRFVGEKLSDIIQTSRAAQKRCGKTGYVRFPEIGLPILSNVGFAQRHV